MDANAISFFRFLERRLGGAAEDGSVRLEARALNPTVPFPLGLIPGDQAAHVGAHRRSLDRHARLVPVDRDAFSVQVEHTARSTRHGAERLSLSAGDAIADHVVRLVLVLPQVVPDAAADALAG